MMKKFKLSIAAPDGMRFDGDAVMLSVRGIAGELAVMAGHIPFVTALKAGDCRVYLDEDGHEVVKHASLSGGMLMVADDCVRVMSSDFRWKE